MASSDSPRVALVSMPFGSIAGPNVAISVLKAVLEQNGLPCDNLYLSFGFAAMVGTRDYMDFTYMLDTSLAGEWMFSQDYFDGRSSDWETFYTEVLADPNWGMPEEGARIVRHFSRSVRPFLDWCLQNDWDSYDIVGFNLTFEQTVSSLALARRLKQERPGIRIIFGGSNCELPMGRALFEQNDCIDVLVSGEGEAVLPLLVRAIRDNQLDKVDLPGVCWRVNGHTHKPGSDNRPLVNLKQNPFADFSDYFQQLDQFRKLEGQLGRPPELKENFCWMESSRGCWWGAISHCTFCGINANAMQFRERDWQDVLDDLNHQHEKYHCARFSFVDPILPLGYLKTLMPALAGQSERYSIYYETKSNLKKEHLRLLARAGVITLQPGIESFSDSTLRLMGKGVAGLQNLQFLKWCERFGIRVYWNLIYGFPGEDPGDYPFHEHLCRRITHLQPPDFCGRIHLDRFSPNFKRWKEFGFSDVRPLPAYARVFPYDPSVLSQLAYFFDYGYADESHNPRALSASLRDFVAMWRCKFESKQNGTLFLSQTSDGEYLLKDTRFNWERRTVVLSPEHGQVLRLCDTASTLEAVIGGLATIGMQTDSRKASEFLEFMIECGVVIKINQRYLSLAVLSLDEAEER